jgi:tripartite-type tricarboxylate transporter receptor subunit TctC
MRTIAPMRRIVLAATLLLCHFQPAAAAWPDRPIQLIVPFPAGGVVDVVARGFAQALGERLGVAVAVTDRDGASGAIGVRAIVAARPDGYTLGFSPAGAIVTQPSLVRNVGYSLASVQPLCQVFSGGYVLVAGRGGPATAQEALERARRQPGAVSFGFGGNGTPPHWTLLGIQRATGVEFNGVPFRGDPPLATALLGGELALGVLGTGSTLAGLPVLLSFSAERSPDFPDVPTAREIGVPVEETVFGGLVAPAGLPEEIAHRLEAECLAAMTEPRLAASLRTARLDRVVRDGRSFGAALAADAIAKRELARIAGLLAE